MSTTVLQVEDIQERNTNTPSNTYIHIIKDNNHKVPKDTGSVSSLFPFNRWCFWTFPMFQVRLCDKFQLQQRHMGKGRVGENSRTKTHHLGWPPLRALYVYIYVYIYICVMCVWVLNIQNPPKPARVRRFFVAFSPVTVTPNGVK